jgi:hypothetical protein
MVTVGLLSIIVLGLLAMFNQTQRAFKTSMTQTDVLESGRATMDMVTRELEQMVPSDGPDFVLAAGGTVRRATNFFAELSPGFTAPLVQELVGSALPRSNTVQRFFFLTRLNQDLIGTAYQVLPEDATGVVGRLYRFSTTNVRSANITVSSEILAAAQTAFLNNRNGLPIPGMITNQNSGRVVAVNRIADGVVHLRTRAFARNGFLLMNTNNAFLTVSNEFAVTPRGPYTNVQNTAVYRSALDSQQAACYFMSNAVPGYVEVELGILEPQILRRYRAIETPVAQRQYLTNHAAQVHLFRQHVPVRNVDFTAYP